MTISAAAAAKSLQSCPTLCDPIDGSPPGSPFAGILQARTPEWQSLGWFNFWSGNSDPACCTAWPKKTKNQKAALLRVYICLIHFVVHLKLTQHWKSTILLFSHPFMSDSLQPHGWQHARILCPSASPEVCPSSCPLSWWCHPTILSSAIPLLLLLSMFPSIRICFSELALHIRWPKYWSFSLSPSSEYSVLISFRIDWFYLLAVQGTPKSLL